ncbi:MAG TPA: carboxypeptidase regulatory-like domain-containing protein [Vicinamibacterales bacterium]|nr:carboxypeptidase regulatory-like domain-containing protein [Vicinamibacterales bacterium]
MKRVVPGVLCVTALLTLFAGAAEAQAIGQIFGKVTDPSGATLPGVTVTVSGPALQSPLVTTTAESGAYQFPSVPVGTYTVSFELSSFKKASRPGVEVTTGFSAQIDQKLDVGAMSEEVTVSAASPVVDTKKTTTGATFTKDVLENIPTARDPWQVINMAPGVQLNAANVGGSRSGQQLTPTVYGSSANVQWNLEGGSITDLGSNSSSSYYNFDSFEQIQVTTGGGDVSVQSSGLSINLVTKSGSNIFKGTATTTFSNDKLQFSNVSEELFTQGSSGFLSGNPINKIANYSIEYGGPIKKNRLWWWAAASRQDINAGVLNFFDPAAGQLCSDLTAAQAAGQALNIAYDQLEDVQNCLKNDRTLIVDYEWKFNYQLNASNKFQFLFTSDNKFRNARGASASTTIDAVNEQTAPAPWNLPYATPVLTHTWIATDKLVFNNQFTYVNGGFNQDYQGSYTEGKCGGLTEYLGNTDYNDYLTGDRANPDCLFNRQSLLNRTTGLNSRTLNSTFQNLVPTWEAKTDATYFTSNRLGGDHSLKFGLGWRRAPQMTFSHYSGGARAQQQCIGNNRNNCGGGVTVPAGSAAGFTAYQAILYRDQLRNNDWWTYNGYLQDSYSRGRLRINGGLRYDWQTSKYLGGCVPNNPIRPETLPAQCEDATSKDPVTGRELQSFSNWSPRVSVIYDLRGDGKTSVRASYSYYFATRIVLANALGGLFVQPQLTWGNNLSSGACAANTACWQDLNLDSVIQANELTGTPTSASSRFNMTTGILSPAGNTVDPSAKIGRTREFITGVQHELIPNLAVGVEYVYRKYDRGTTTYTIGYEPGAPGFPISALYTGPFQYTDPVTGITAPYYQICPTCTRPSGLGSIALTNPNYQVYSGVTGTVNKRFSNKWQLNGSATWQTNPQYTPVGGYTDPQGVEFNDGYSTLARYLIKLNGSYALPWGFQASANFNVQDGANRAITINGPGNVFGGVGQGTISRSTITYQPNGSDHLEANKLLDLGLQKTFAFSGGRYRAKLMLDAFNVFNTAKILAYSSNNSSSQNFTVPTSIIPPRVIRLGAQFTF